MFVMVAVSFAVCGDMHELQPVSLVREAAFQAGGKILAVIQQLFKSHRLGDRAVIEEEVNLFARREAGQIGACRIDAPSLYILPASSADLANPRRLARCQHCELDSASGQDFESSKINGGLRQPHAFRRLSKPMLKIADPPQHL